MARERTCVVDKKKYIYCPPCGKGDPNETWRYIYCSEDCRELFHIASDWTAKKLSATAAKIRLDGINVPPLENLQSSLKKNLDEIYSEASV